MSWVFVLCAYSKKNKVLDRQVSLNERRSCLLFLKKKKLAIGTFETISSCTHPSLFFSSPGFGPGVWLQLDSLVLFYILFILLVKKKFFGFLATISKS